MREVNEILAGCPAFWCSSDVPLMSKHLGRANLQQLHHQVTMFIESVRAASRWIAESSVTNTEGSVVDAVMPRSGGARDVQETDIEASQTKREAAPVSEPQNHSTTENPGIQRRSIAISTELTHWDLPGRSATLAYRDVGVLATPEPAYLLGHYFHKRHLMKPQNTLCVFECAASSMFLTSHDQTIPQLPASNTHGLDVKDDKCPRK